MDHLNNREVLNINHKSSLSDINNLESSIYRSYHGLETKKYWCLDSDA